MIPEYVMMGPHKISISIVPGLKDSDNEEVEGLWRPFKHQVLINGHFSKTHQLEVLVHELVHAASDFSAAGLEENQVTPIAVFLCQALAPLWKTE